MHLSNSNVQLIISFIQSSLPRNSYIRIQKLFKLLIFLIFNLILDFHVFNIFCLFVQTFHNSESSQLTTRFRISYLINNMYMYIGVNLAFLFNDFLLVNLSADKYLPVILFAVQVAALCFTTSLGIPFLGLFLIHITHKLQKMDFEL